MNVYQFWTVECRTGCSCCADQNHYYGICASEKLATDALPKLSARKHLGSQFAESGRYKLVKLWGKVYFSPLNLEQAPEGQETSCALVLFDDPDCSDVFAAVIIDSDQAASIQEGTFSVYFRKAL